MLLQAVVKAGKRGVSDDRVVQVIEVRLLYIRPYNRTTTLVAPFDIMIDPSHGPVSKLNYYSVHFFYNPNLPYKSVPVSHTVFHERT